MNKDKICLFKNGNFYLLLGNDAVIMNRELGLKLTKFSNETNKCGFPITEFIKYEKFIKLLGYDYEIIFDEIDQIIDDIKNIDLDVINGETAINKIVFYKELLSNKFI